METIGGKELWSFVDGAKGARKLACSEVRAAQGHRVRTFLELARKVAELQFRNRDHVLLFRGQRGDFRNRAGNSSLKPTLLRDPAGRRVALAERFARLAKAEKELARRWETAGLLGKERLGRHRILRWSVLQHYEVCATPLLDVTHSLRIACSFASLEAAGDDEVFLFVLGVPNLSGAVTASAEAGLQIVRLASVCPPSAVRPHLQEGYLLGEYPELDAYEQKQRYDAWEVDFGRRLVAKFRFRPSAFWKDADFPRVSREALYPSAERDELVALAERVRASLGGGRAR